MDINQLLENLDLDLDLDLNLDLDLHQRKHPGIDGPHSFNLPQGTAVPAPYVPGPVTRPEITGYHFRVMGTGYSTSKFEATFA
jgi:hypothetical protein